MPLVQACKYLRRGKEQHNECRARSRQREGLHPPDCARYCGLTQNAGDSEAKRLRRLMAIERHRHPPLSRTLLFEPEQGARIHHWIGTDFQCKIIAAQFALVANSAADPPDRGMEKEQ